MDNIDGRLFLYVCDISESYVICKKEVLDELKKIVPFKYEYNYYNRGFNKKIKNNLIECEKKNDGDANYETCEKILCDILKTKKYKETDLTGISQYFYYNHYEYDYNQFMEDFKSHFKDDNQMRIDFLNKYYESYNKYGLHEFFSKNITFYNLYVIVNILEIFDEIQSVGGYAGAYINCDDDDHYKRYYDNDLYEDNKCDGCYINILSKNLDQCDWTPCDRYYEIEVCGKNKNPFEFTTEFYMYINVHRLDDN